MLFGCFKVWDLLWLALWLTAKHSQENASFRYVYGCWSKFFLSETAILSQTKNYFSQTFAFSKKKLSRVPLFHNMWEIWTYTQRNRCVLLLFTVILAHLLLPVLTLPHRNQGLTCLLSPWKQDITSQQFRPPSLQEKAVFRQALSKLSPNFREKSPYINIIFKKSMYVPVNSSHILLLSRNFRKKKL